MSVKNFFTRIDMIMKFCRCNDCEIEIGYEEEKMALILRISHEDTMATLFLEEDIVKIIVKDSEGKLKEKKALTYPNVIPYLIYIF